MVIEHDAITYKIEYFSYLTDFVFNSERYIKRMIFYERFMAHIPREFERSN